jgi:uncharacterized protein (DUF2336 family)
LQDATSAPQLRALEGLAAAGHFRQLADMAFLPSQVLQPHERAYISDLIKVALPAAPEDERMQFAGRLADAGVCSPDLLSVLARDETIAVASRILTSAVVLEDDDLVDLVHNACDKRRGLIARRPGLSATVTAVLVGAGDPETVALALANPKAKFSAASLDFLIGRAEQDTILRKPLAARQEMNPALALKLFWVLAASERTPLLFRFLADNQELGRTLVARHMATGAGAGDTGTVLFEQTSAFYAVGDAVKGGETLGELAGIRPEAGTRIFADPGGEAIAVALKAAGLGLKHLAELLARGRRAGLAPLSDAADIEALYVLFDRLSRGQARMAVTYWDWHAARIGPYARQAPPLAAQQPVAAPDAAAGEPPEDPPPPPNPPIDFTTGEPVALTTDEEDGEKKGEDRPAAARDEDTTGDQTAVEPADEALSLPRLKGPNGYLSDIFSS